MSTGRGVKVYRSWHRLLAVFICLYGGDVVNGSPEKGGATLKATTTTSADLLAKYIVAGIGMTSSHTTGTSPASVVSVNSIHANGTKIVNPSRASASGTLGAATNDTCWNDWVGYWSSKSPYSIPAATSWVVATDDYAYIPYLTTTTWISENSWTLTSLSTEYSEGYPMSVHTSLTTSTGGGDWMTVTENSRVPTTSLRSYPATSWRTTTRSNVTTPPCQLPSLVPQCESQWSSYMAEQDTITNELTPKPACTQASVKSSDCETLVSQYLFQWTWNGETEGAGYQTTNNSTYWPTSKSFAPGCEMGCRQCSITGQSVQLYWWPPRTKELVENGTATAAITNGGSNSSGPVSVFVDGTYLTSPTVYISYDTLYASDSCSGIGASYTNTIIPLSNSDHLFSMETRWDPSISVHGFKTVPFNYSDLIEPIPDSVYNKQVRCQRSYTDFMKAGGLMHNATFSCPRTDSYAPILAVPPEVRSLNPEWTGCAAWYGGLYDPPLALQPASVEATPTLPAAPTSTQASPSPAVDPSSPVQTALPVTLPQDPTTTKASENGAEIIAGIFASSSTTTYQSLSSVAPEPISRQGFNTAVTMDGQTFSVSRTGESVYINGMHAKSGLVTVSGHTFSIGSSALAIDDNIVAYAAAAHATASEPGPHKTIVTLDEGRYNIEDKSGSLFINGMQVPTGLPVTVSGHVFSAGSSALDIDESRVWTYASPTRSPSSEDDPETVEVVVDGTTLTAEKGEGGVVIDGKTYSIGQQMTVSDYGISFGSDGVIVGTSTAEFRGTTDTSGTGAAATFSSTTTASRTSSPPDDSQTSSSITSAGSSPSTASLALLLLTAITMGWSLL